MYSEMKDDDNGFSDGGYVGVFYNEYIKPFKKSKMVGSQVKLNQAFSTIV